MNPLFYICLSVFIGLIVKAYLRLIVMNIVKARGWVYVALAGEEGKEHRAEVLAAIHSEIEEYENQRDSSDAIALKILVHLVRGLPTDIAWCAPSIPGFIFDKIIRWSDALRHFKIPAAMVAGVATLGLINYSFFSSSTNQSFGTWLFANSIVIALTVLLWKHKHPLARRIFHIWMGISIVMGIAIMVWLTVNYHLYEIMTFKILMLAMVAVSPLIIVLDKSWRQRLFRGRRWLIAICWATIIAGSFAGSLLVAHDAKPLLEMWKAMAMLAIGMLIVYGLIALAAYVLCWLGIRGSAGMMRMVASRIRRLH